MAALVNIFLASLRHYRVPNPVTPASTVIRAPPQSFPHPTVIPAKAGIHCV